jgi:hypothetical protein
MVRGERDALLSVQVVVMAATTQMGLRHYWQSLKRGQPGRRFQAQYESSHRREKRASVGLRVSLMAAALVCFAIGVVLVFIPGPAFVFFILGGGLLASESRSVARVMDWSEVQARHLAGWVEKTWRRLNRIARVAVVVAGLGLGAAGAFVIYRWILG